MIRRDLIKKILNETRIINSAAKANDVKIISNSIAEKGKYIDELSQLDTSDLSEDEQTMMDEIFALDEENVELVKLNQQALIVEMNQNRKKKLVVSKQSNLTQKYKNPYANQLGGSYIDKKK